MDYLQPKFYRFNEDSLWLADKVIEEHGQESKSLVDVGCGCGVIGVELANRLPKLRKLTLLEPQKDFLSSIESNLSLLEHRPEVEIFNGFIGDYRGEFDLVVSNPPYFEHGYVRQSRDENRRRCRSFGSSENIVSFAQKLGELLGGEGAGYMLVRKSNPNFAKLWEIDSLVMQKCDERKDVALLKMRRRIPSNTR